MKDIDELQNLCTALEDHECTLNMLMRDAQRDGIEWLASAVENLLFDVRAELRDVDRELDELERVERNVMNREYERMVL